MNYQFSLYIALDVTYTQRIIDSDYLEYDEKHFHYCATLLYIAKDMKAAIDAVYNDGEIQAAARAAVPKLGTGLLACSGDVWDISIIKIECDGMTKNEAGFVDLTLNPNRYYDHFDFENLDDKN